MTFTNCRGASYFFDHFNKEYNKDELICDSVAEDGWPDSAETSPQNITI